MQNTEFFTLVPVQDALATLFRNIASLQAKETLSVAQVSGRVLAVAPRSPIALPEFTRSTMDGYAVRAADTFGASESLPAYLDVVGVVEMGTVPDVEVQPTQTAEIHTGAMLPAGADAVVMIERTQKVGESEIEVMAPVAPGENLVQIGEDVARDAEVLPVGHRLRPQDIGGLLAVGITEVEVVKAPRVAILSCGDELVPPEQTPQTGQIRDINAYILAAMFEQAGAEVTILGIARDTLDDVLGKAQTGFREHDMLVMSAGSSVSVRDLTKTVINRLGEPGVLQHGIAVKPGKPTIIAACEGKPVVGLPGNPVSAMLVARQIVLPTIGYLLGERLRLPYTINAVLSQNIASTTGREDTVPVRLEIDDENITATPIFGKSNLIYTLVNADGVVRVPLNSNGMKAGSSVNVVAF
jgi:molybdopterin molybdotransferase